MRNCQLHLVQTNFGRLALQCDGHAIRKYFAKLPTMGICSVLLVTLAKKLHAACAQQLTTCFLPEPVDSCKPDKGSSLHQAHWQSFLQEQIVSSGMCAPY